MIKKFAPDPERLKLARQMMQETIANFDVINHQLDDLIRLLDRDLECQRQSQRRV